MMLGFYFVFATHYSENLSDNIGRWNDTTVKKGKSLWRPKYGYIRDEKDGYYKPHKKYHGLMREAFEMKLYMNESDKKIAEWLNANDFYVETKNTKKRVSPGNLYRIRIDSFYYGIYVSGETIMDMRHEDVNPFYKPIISEEEHQKLIDRHDKSKPVLAPRERKGDTKEYDPFPQHFLKTEDGYSLSCYIPNPLRFKKKLLKLRETNPKASLNDIVENHQIRFKVGNAKSKHHKAEITFDVVEKKVLKMLDTLKINKEAYDEYKNFINSELDKINMENEEKQSKLTLQLNRAKRTKKDYIQKNMHIQKNKDEEEVYQEEIQRYNIKIQVLQDKRNDITISERNKMLEFELFVKVLHNAGKYYRKATYVQKRKIVEILFSNIVIHNKKRLTIAVKPHLESLFIWLSGDGGNRTHVWKA